MKRILYILIPVILLGLTVFKLMTNKKTAEEKIYHYDKEQPVMVQVDTVRLQSVDAEQLFTGAFEPEKEVKISAESQGKITAIYVETGSFVKKGQLLLKIDDALLNLQLQSVNVQIDGLENDIRRYTVLAQADAIQGVQLEKAQLAMKAARVQRNTIQEQIRKTNVIAPFSGIITMKFSETGAFAAPGVPLLQITDISRLRFTVNVPENSLGYFTLNKNYPVKTDVYKGLNLQGKVVLVGSKSNIGNSFPIQFLVTNTSDLKIKSGMFGKVIVSGVNRKDGILIPASAIVGSDIEPQVYIVKDNKAVLQKISIDQRIKNNIVVASGIDAGDVIVTGGFINLHEGARVAIKN